MSVHDDGVAVYLLFLKALLASEELSSVYITTVNNEKYRCSLPPLSGNNEKVSVCHCVILHLFIE